MQIVNRHKSIAQEPSIYSDNLEGVTLKKTSEIDALAIYELQINQDYIGKKIELKWKLENLGVKGYWTPNNILEKRFRSDWELPSLKSSISNDAPIISLFGYEDENIATVSTSECIHLVNIEASLREEDNCFYFSFQFFQEQVEHKDYTIKLLVDKTPGHFSHKVKDAADWLLQENDFETMPVFAGAATPLYSTWYSFHQDLETDLLLEECIEAKNLGCNLVIVDDGWQTLDNNRGYDFTGDWKAERLTNMAEFVQKLHAIDMKVMLWYSVPFCGIKSEAYQTFKGKFLTENHHWAPVFDPRFPEVRDYLVSIYRNAITDWDLDGFKLDFIDDFKVYPETETTEMNGRDTLSVTEGVLRLIQEIKSALTAIKPEILIEFRQKYISPALRQLGNMLRAFDCPNDSLMNRVRTTDVKLICGDSAVHSDMLTWHKDEPVEVAALQFTSILFSVPQVSVRLKERTAKEKAMIGFYNAYWTENKHVLLNGNFTAHKPLANYPILSAKNDKQKIIGVYEDVLVAMQMDLPVVHIINGKLSEEIVLKCNGDKEKSRWNMEILDCYGSQFSTAEIEFNGSAQSVSCPANGIIILTKT